MDINTDLRKVVLITGCSDGGIGSSLAKTFALKNYKTYATARSLEKMKELEAFGCIRKLMDVTNRENVCKVIKEILEAEGKIDILVNNAGVTISAPIIEADIKDVREVYDCNVFSVLNLIQMVVPNMILRKQGTIVNIGSIAGDLNRTFGGIYGSSKSALHSISDTLRLELMPFNIDVITVKPGAVKSNINTNNLLYKQQQDEIVQSSLYKDIYGYVMKCANYSQTHSPMNSDVFCNRIVSYIENRQNPLFQKFYFFINPFAVIISALAYIIGFLIPSLKPSMSYFKSYTWPYKPTLVLGGSTWAYYLSNTLPNFLIDMVIWSMFGLGYLAKKVELDKKAKEQDKKSN